MSVLSMLVLLAIAGPASGQPERRDRRPAPVRVAEDQRSFERTDGTPFFYLADTAWTGVTRLSKEDMETYLADRAARGFTVIQTALVPWDARRIGNRDGQRPFQRDDESRPNAAYWARVDHWLERIDAHGMVPAVVPFWLRGRNATNTPTPADAESLRAYARFLGRRYRDLDLIWLLGADARADAWAELIADFAGELEQASGRRTPASRARRPWPMTHHPEGAASSARLFHDAAWLDFNGLQSGHTLAGNHDLLIDDAWSREPAKPVVDLEPAYEHITNGLVPVTPGVRLVNDHDVRRQAWQAVFAGAAGHAYGCAEVYEFHTESQARAHWIVGADWKDALAFPGADHMRHLRTLMEQLPMAGRVPDQSLIGGAASSDVQQRRRAIRNSARDRICIYLPVPGVVTLQDADLLAVAPETAADAWSGTWFDPRTGEQQPAVPVRSGGRTAWHSPGDQTTPDWTLILTRNPAEPTPP